MGLGLPSFLKYSRLIEIGFLSWTWNSSSGSLLCFGFSMRSETTGWMGEGVKKNKLHGKLENHLENWRNIENIKFASFRRYDIMVTTLKIRIRVQIYRANEFFLQKIEKLKKKK